MELYQELLLTLLQQQHIQVTFPDLNISAQDFVECQCYQALNEINTVIHDDSLDDGECFAKIEEIIQIFENIGSTGGLRHDFG